MASGQCCGCSQPIWPSRYFNGWPPAGAVQHFLASLFQIDPGGIDIRYASPVPTPVLVCQSELKVELFFYSVRQMPCCSGQYDLDKLTISTVDSRDPPFTKHNLSMATATNQSHCIERTIQRRTIRALVSRACHLACRCIFPFCHSSATRRPPSYPTPSVPSRHQSLPYMAFSFNSDSARGIRSSRACEPSLIFFLTCRRRNLPASVACSGRPRADDVEVALLAKPVQCGCSACPPRYPRLLESSLSSSDFALVKASLARFVIIWSSSSTSTAGTPRPVVLIDLCIRYPILVSSLSMWMPCNSPPLLDFALVPLVSTTYHFQKIMTSINPSSTVMLEKWTGLTASRS
ncbi:hypothetical protein ACLOJK_017720 [Asimina triloba]